MSEAELYQLLKTKYGFDEFRPGQLAVIQDLLAGQDVLAVLPTGTGKSLIYQLVGTVVPGIVVVVSPLISLMQDQVARLNYQGEKQVAALTSQLDFSVRQQLLANLNQVKFLFISPEMLQQTVIQEALAKLTIALLVIDEAHCISTWGPDFRPDYRRLGPIRQQLGTPRTLMLTATATPQVRQDILTQLNATDAQQVLYSVNRSNIYLAVEAVNDEADKRATLQHLVTSSRGPAIVYFTSKRQTDLIAEWLRTTTELRVAAYHAGLAAEDRFKIQQQFMADQLDVICATSAFGMGINKADIRLVIHYHLPTTLADYVQEIGRAGRDGQQALAVMLYAPGDENLVRNLNELTAATPNEVQQDFARHQAGQPVTDDRSRVLEAYWQQAVSPAEVAEIFAARQAAKEHELRDLMRYVQTTTCHRAVMLAYFDETEPPHTDRCCQLAGEPLPLDELGLTAVKPSISPTVVTWEQRLAQLFLPNS